MPLHTEHNHLITEPHHNKNETAPTRLNSVMTQPDIQEDENRNVHETEPDTKYRKSFDNKYGKKSAR